VFFLPPSFLWLVALLVASFLSGASVAAWGYFFKSGTPRGERLKTVASALINTNIIMIMLNMSAILISPFLGLGLAMLMLAAAVPFVFWLPETSAATVSLPSEPDGNLAGVARPMAFLCLFIIVITITSGLMFKVVGPAFAHLEWLTSWYWAVPYTVAIFMVKKLPRKVNLTYILFLAIAMIGFSFIFFLLLDRSAPSYLLINALMMGAFGVFDLFWWSILGEMLSFGGNPAKILGMGLSANVFGVFLGGLAGLVLAYAGTNSYYVTLLALAAVCVTMVLLPPLHKSLTGLLKEHEFLTVLSEMAPKEQDQLVLNFSVSGQLTKREREIAALLLRGKSYRMISTELHVSENTIKTHVKNIYAKAGVRSKAELAGFLLEGQTIRKA
jgi:DNA-binding CsgD family transcriptional regulator